MRHRNICFKCFVFEALGMTHHWHGGQFLTVIYHICFPCPARTGPVQNPGIGGLPWSSDLRHSRSMDAASHRAMQESTKSRYTTSAQHENVEMQTKQSGATKVRKQYLESPLTSSRSTALLHPGILAGRDATRATVIVSRAQVKQSVCRSCGSNWDIFLSALACG